MRFRGMRQVSVAEGEDLARKLDCRFWETSAKDAVNVEEVFVGMTRAYKKFRLGEVVPLDRKARIKQGLKGRLRLLRRLPE